VKRLGEALVVFLIIVASPSRTLLSVLLPHDANLAPNVLAESCGVYDLLADEDELLCYRLDLGNQGLVDEAAEAEAVEAVDQAELEELLLQVDGGEIKAVQGTGSGNGEQSLELLEQENALQVKARALEERVEGIDVQALVLAEAEEELEVEGVDLGQILDINGAEALQVVEAGEVDGGGALLNRLGWGSSGHGGQSGDDDTGELHFDCCWGCKRASWVLLSGL